MNETTATEQLEAMKGSIIAEIEGYEAFLSDPDVPQDKVEKTHMLLDEAEGDLRIVQALLDEGGVV